MIEYITLQNITFIAAMAMIFIALPLQIKRQYTNKTTVHITLAFLPLIVYGCRAVATALDHIWYVAIPDAFGAILSLVFVVQYFMYYRNEK